jgi:ABC-type nitrate/sulfonate/bicarbonate transport system permease component
MINPAGIGWALAQAQSALRPDLLFAYAIVTGLLGYLINVALVVGVRLCMPGSPALRSRA